MKAEEREKYEGPLFRALRIVWPDLPGPRLAAGQIKQALKAEGFGIVEAQAIREAEQSAREEERENAVRAVAGMSTESEYIPDTVEDRRAKELAQAIYTAFREDEPTAFVQGGDYVDSPPERLVENPEEYDWAPGKTLIDGEFNLVRIARRLSALWPRD